MTNVETAPTKRAGATRARPDMLDKSRDFGKCWSSTGHPEAAFFQNGKYYNAQGERIRQAGDEVREAETAAATEKVRTQQAAALRRQADAVERGEDAEETIDDDTGDGINLRMWGLGQVKYRFGAVRSAILTRYHRAVHKETDALDFLLEVKLITSAELKQMQIARKRA